MGILMDLDTLLEAGTDDELRAAMAQCQTRLERRDSERKRSALAEAKRLLKAAGISAKIGKKKERK